MFALVLVCRACFDSELVVVQPWRSHRDYGTVAVPVSAGRTARDPTGESFDAKPSSAYEEPE